MSSLGDLDGQSILDYLMPDEAWNKRSEYVLILLLALTPRVWTLDQRSLWLDERVRN